MKQHMSDKNITSSEALRTKGFVCVLRFHKSGLKSFQTDVRRNKGHLATKLSPCNHHIEKKEHEINMVSSLNRIAEQMKICSTVKRKREENGFYGSLGGDWLHLCT